MIAAAPIQSSPAFPRVIVTAAVQGLRALAVVAGLLILGGCTANPITGRSQFMLVSEQSAIKGSASAYTGMVAQQSRQKKVETGTPRVERITQITNELIAQAVRFRPETASWQWELTVIDDPKIVNAFCMAGGKMGIYTGFWDKFHATDDELAQVMGHEIGHAIASHTREKMSIAMGVGFGSALIAGIVGARTNNSALAQAGYITAAGAAALAITLPNSREAEGEADQIGLELAARAGYNPQAAVELWQKMAKEEGGTAFEFFSTHPSPENRAVRLNELIKQVEPLYEGAKKNPPGPIPNFLGTPKQGDAAAPSRQEWAAKLAAEPQVMTFIAGDFERFKQGQTEFTCGFECGLAYTTQKGKWKQMRDKVAWRDLAVSVLRVGYDNDLSYFMLAEAAAGLGLRDAAVAYYRKALEAEKTGKGCAGGFNSCEGLDVLALASAALGDAMVRGGARP